MQYLAQLIGLIRGILTRAIADSGYRNHRSLKDRRKRIVSIFRILLKISLFCGPDMMRDVRYALEPPGKLPFLSRASEIVSNSDYRRFWFVSVRVIG